MVLLPSRATLAFPDLDFWLTLGEFFGRVRLGARISYERRNVCHLCGSVGSVCGGRGFPIPALWWWSILAGALDPAGVPQVRTPNLGDAGDDLPTDTLAARGLAWRHLLGLHTEEWGQTAWAWLHKLHRALVRPGRDRLSGQVEVDERI